MPNLTIYVPRELAEQVRRHNVQISATCRVALARAVRQRERAAQNEVAAIHASSRKHPGGRPA